MRSRRFQSNSASELFVQLSKHWCSTSVTPRAWVETESACFGSGLKLGGINYVHHDNRWLFNVVSRS